MDFLIGSSDLPVIDFRYGDTHATSVYDSMNPTYFKTSFWDDRLVQDFSDQVNTFCSHARRWPLAIHWNYFKKFPKQYMRDGAAQKDLIPENLREHLEAALPQQNLVSLTDFEKFGFETIVFDSHYFYPEVKKFNYYIFVVAKLTN